MRKAAYFFCGIIIGLFSMSLFFRYYYGNKVNVVDTIFSDTIVDTVRIYPTVQDSVIVNYVTQVLPIKKDTTIYNVTRIDTLVKDSAEVVIKITQKHYSDSTYEAWVSGFRPNLDSIRLYIPTISNTLYIKDKPKRFSIGVTAGYGVTRHGMSPYIGVGVTYSLYNFR